MGEDRTSRWGAPSLHPAVVECLAHSWSIGQPQTLLTTPKANPLLHVGPKTTKKWPEQCGSRSVGATTTGRDTFNPVTFLLVTCCASDHPEAAAMQTTAVDCSSTTCSPSTMPYHSSFSSVCCHRLALEAMIRSSPA